MNSANASAIAWLAAAIFPRPHGKLLHELPFFHSCSCADPLALTSFSPIPTSPPTSSPPAPSLGCMCSGGYPKPKGMEADAYNKRVNSQLSDMRRDDDLKARVDKIALEK